MYNLSDLNGAISFIIERGGYTNTFFLDRRDDESYETYYYRIVSIASRINKCLKSYPKEILAYYQAHPDLPAPSLESLENMNYKELADLRTKLGIRKKRRTAKKVTSSTPAPKTAETAKRYLKDIPTSTLAASIMANNDEKDHFESILTEEEIASMYGEDNLPSLEDLRSVGITPEYSSEYEKRLRFKP